MSATAKDISAVLKRQGAVALSSGFSAVQSASLSAALLSGGASEEIAATALKNITGALLKGEHASKAQQGAFAQLGFDPTQLSQAMISDAPATLIEVFEAMQAVPEAQISALVSVLFGEEVKGSVMPLLRNLDNLKNAFKLTATATQFKGSMEAEFQTRSATTANHIKLLSNKFERLQISVGTLLLPVLNDIIGPLADFADVLADAAEKFPLVAKGIALVGIGLVALKVGALVLKMVGLSFGQGINALKLGRAKLSATTGQTARNASLANLALKRLSATMAQMGRGGFGGATGRGKQGNKRRRSRSRRGKLGQVFAALNNGPGVLQNAGKLVKPLGIAISGAALSTALLSGDSLAIGANTGDIVGGLGGAAAGAMAGAALGSVVPIIGTVLGGVVGSLLGGFAGSEMGAVLGEKISLLFEDQPKPPLKAPLAERTSKPDSSLIAPVQVSELFKQNNRVNGNTDQLTSPAPTLKQLNSQDKRQIVFSPTINLPASSGNPAADQHLIESLVERMKQDLLPIMGSGDLAIRLDANLTDPGAL